jgi:hypothetical protein
MSEYLHEELTNSTGYVKKSGRPRAGLVPLALTQDGQVVYGLKRITLGTLQQKKLMDYDDEVERQRRLLCDSALGLLALLNPKYVQNAVKKVGRGVKDYWTGLKLRAGDDVVKNILKESGNRVYGATSYGRRDTTADTSAAASTTGGEVAIAKARIDMWFSELDKGTLDVPKLMSLYDYFYCKVFSLVPNGTTSPEYMRAETKKSTWRPTWYEQTGPRGRANAKDPANTTSSPGLLSETFTIPNPLAAIRRCGVDPGQLEVQQRKRGWDMFVISARDMNTEFKDHLAAHNLAFSASASGTTSTLFLAAEAFASLSGFPDEEKKQYLLACVVYLVSGGMHTCHEVFWTGKNIGIVSKPEQYLEALPASFTSTLQCEKWTSEFWDIVRPDFTTVRGAAHRK